ncbi:MAG: DUF2442 domain-containing protein [Bryobacteraceae bacterium]
MAGGGIGIHWEAIDEDISVASLPRPENFMRLPAWACRRPPQRLTVVEVHAITGNLLPSKQYTT